MPHVYIAPHKRANRKEVKETTPHGLTWQVEGPYKDYDSAAEKKKELKNKGLQVKVHHLKRGYVVKSRDPEKVKKHKQKQKKDAKKKTK